MGKGNVMGFNWLQLVISIILHNTVSALPGDNDGLTVFLNSTPVSTEAITAPSGGLVGVS